MPHVIVKLWPGKSEQQKKRLADAITKDVMEILGYGEKSISVALEEVRSGLGGASVPSGHRRESRQALQEAGVRPE